MILQRNLQPLPNPTIPFPFFYSQLLGKIFEQLAKIEMGAICVGLCDGSYRREW